MTALSLYRVTVTQEWSAEAEALVWAPDEVSAKRLAQKRVEVDIEDASSGSCWSVAKPEPLDDRVMDRMDDDDLWLIMPNGVTREAVEDQQRRMGDRYGATWIAECRILPDTMREPAPVTAMDVALAAGALSQDLPFLQRQSLLGKIRRFLRQQADR